MPREARRGFALITALGGVVLAAMLLGAFFLSHRSSLALAGQNADSRACQEALLTLSDYCRFQLEKQKTWTTVPPLPDPEVVMDSLNREILRLDHLSDEELEERPDLADLPGQAHLVGRLAESGVEVHLAVSNHLNGVDAVSPDGVARRSCRIRMEARRGRARERVELLVRKQAFFDSTVFASRQVDIQADMVTFSSTDPVRNQVRSLDDVRLPEQENLRFEFRLPEGEAPPVRGTVWARDEISVGGLSDSATLASAAEATQAQFMPDAPGRYNPPRLNKEDVTEQSGLTEVWYEPSVYSFGAVEVTYQDSDRGLVTESVGCLYRGQPQGDGAPIYDGVVPPTDAYFLLPPTADLDSVTTGLDGLMTHPQVVDGFEVPQGPRVHLRSPSGGGVPPEPLVTFPANAEIRVPGDLVILAPPHSTPEIRFGSGAPGKGVINAERDVCLQGRLLGTASIVAGQDILMTPNEVEVLNDVEGDVALYAGRDVKVAPRFTDDFGLLRESGFFTLRGLVYAGRDFSFQTSATLGGDQAQYQRELDIEGALVAREGGVSIAGDDRVEIRYNPNYLDKFLERLSNESSVQLDVVSWRPLP